MLLLNVASCDGCFGWGAGAFGGGAFGTGGTAGLAGAGVVPGLGNHEGAAGLGGLGDAANGVTGLPLKDWFFIASMDWKAFLSRPASSRATWTPIW